MAIKKVYTSDDILKAKRAMLDHLASLTSGELLLGCCTQGCCDDDPKLAFGVVADLTPPPYTRSELLQAKRAMLSTLAEISGGQMLAGCCTQGCCDDGAIDALINVP